MERQNLIVISCIRNRPNKWKAGERVDYINAYDPATDEVIFVSVKANRATRNFAKFSIAYDREQRRDWNLQYSKIPIQHMQDMDVLNSSKSWNSFTEIDLPPMIYLSYVKSFNFSGKQFQKEISKRYRFRDCKFYNNFLVTPDNLVVHSSQLGNVPIHEYFNNLNNNDNPIRGGFKISGLADLVIRKDENGEWNTQYRLNGDTNVKVTNYELDDLERIQKEYQEDLVYNRLLKWTREQIKEKKALLSAEDIEKQAGKLGLTIDFDGQEFLESVVFKPEYCKRFFDFFKSLTTEKIYCEDNGFFIHLKSGVWVWELPKYGSSTYFFEDQDVSDLWSKLVDTKKSEIIQNKDIQRAIGFINRRKHPIAGEDEYEDNWKESIKKIGRLN